MTGAPLGFVVACLPCVVACGDPGVSKMFVISHKWPSVGPQESVLVYCCGNPQVKTANT